MKIALYEPYLAGNEKRYVLDCLETNWISSRGKYVNAFEEKFARTVNMPHAVAVSNGTVAIHLALAALGIGRGDEVLVPSFTYIASVNPISYVGATPVFVDSRVEDWQMDLDDLERKVTPRTRAVIAVHLYGGVCDMIRLGKFCRERGLRLVEDCAEALGSTRGGRHVGGFGDIGCFSFFGNKTVTTGEGGMVVAGDDALAARLAHLKSQGVSAERCYWHDEIGFNYRMTNIQAAIGLGQLENLSDILQRKRHVAEYYHAEFQRRGLPLEMLWEAPDCRNGFWLPTVALREPQRREALIRNLSERYGVETRPAFYPAHVMPMYENFNTGTLAGAERLSRAGMNLPGHPGLTDAALRRVIDALDTELAARA